MGLQGFNLLKKQPAPPTVWEKVYSWALGTARTIIIIVELIVVGAFVTRIIIDTQGSRLDKEIEDQEHVIAGFEESMIRYRTIQSRTENYKSIWDSSNQYYPIFEEVNGMLNSSFADLRIIIDEDTVTLRGQGDISRISDLETKMKNSATFTNVETFEITTEDDSNARGSFGLRAVIKDEFTRTDVSKIAVNNLQGAGIEDVDINNTN